jgi:D-alanine-D-alanine ligase
MERIGLFFGGPSNEHEVSIDSALNIAENIDTRKYTLIPIFWNKNGEFYLIKNIKKRTDRKKIGVEEFKKHISVALLVTHGKYGEDGVLQSIIESQHIPYAGCHVLASALCMDKSVFKDFISGYKIPQAKYAYIDFNLQDKETINNILKKVKKEFRLPIFVKPANSGSSCGTSKVGNISKLNEE